MCHTFCGSHISNRAHPTAGGGNSTGKEGVGFADESESIIKNGQLKLKSKKLDLVVANSIEGSMGELSAEIYLIDRKEVTHVTKRDKSELGFEIMKHIYKLTKSKGYINDLIN